MTERLIFVYEFFEKIQLAFLVGGVVVSFSVLSTSINVTSRRSRKWMTTHWIMVKVPSSFAHVDHRSWNVRIKLVVWSYVQRQSLRTAKKGRHRPILVCPK